MLLLSSVSQLLYTVASCATPCSCVLAARAAAEARAEEERRAAAKAAAEKQAAEKAFAEQRAAEEGVYVTHVSCISLE
jgi:hypothetical protein